VCAQLIGLAFETPDQMVLGGFRHEMFPVLCCCYPTTPQE
jgi:hypothetical protein